MGNPKIFVGNVGFNTRKETLEQFFAKYGTVVDCYKPEQKGFAFVTMSTPEEAEAAIADMANPDTAADRMIEGRELKAQEARPREEKPRRPRY